MSANEKNINTFATRVRQMILQFEELKRRMLNYILWWMSVMQNQTVGG